VFNAEVLMDAVRIVVLDFQRHVEFADVTIIKTSQLRSKNSGFEELMVSGSVGYHDEITINITHEFSLLL
jgi:hypothetical protein